MDKKYKKITTLQYGRKRLASMGFVPNQRSLNVRVMGALLLLISNVLSGVMFVLCEANTFWEYTNSIFVSLVAGVSLILFTILIIQIWRIFEVIKFSQRTFDNRAQYSTSRIIYIKTNDQVEKWSKITDFILALSIPTAFMLPKPILSFYMYFTTDLGPDAFELTFPIWVPYDWRNPVGYLVTTIYQYISLQRMLGLLELFVTIGIGALLFGIAIVRDMKIVLKSTNKKAIAGEQNSKAQAQKKLNEFIEIHAILKNEIIFISDTLEPYVAVVFMSSLVTICCAMLMIQMELLSNNDDSLVMLGIAFANALYSFGSLFIICEITQNVCDAINSFAMDIGQIDWYLYPIEMKKMLPTIMNMAQKPAELKWFGSFAADRDTFKKICNKAYSFFMVLREFSK